jgi:hypothetical protein
LNKILNFFYVFKFNAEYFQTKKLIGKLEK